MTLNEIKERTHEISTYALKNLIKSYWHCMYRKTEIEIHYEMEGNKDDVENDSEYQFNKAYCEAAEEWMRAIGISTSYLLEFMPSILFE